MLDFSAINVLFFLQSCAGNTLKKEKKYFFSKGFALVYEVEFYEQKIINKKINNEELIVIHSSLKTNTPIKIINPENNIVVEAKINKNSYYPKIFNVVISKKLATVLKLDLNNPYVEIIEIKKNKTFIAEKSNTYDEEKNVAERAPVEEIKMDDLSKEQKIENKDSIKNYNFILLINDFYYLESANNLKADLDKKIKNNKISIKKINDNKYRVFAGPFKNFNALKNTYISLNNLGFENINIYNE